MHNGVQYNALDEQRYRTARVAVARGSSASISRSRSWTLDDLAARSGVSRRLVVQIEQGEANPSIGTLLRLANALGVTLTDLVSDQETTTLGVCAPSDATELWRGRPAVAHCWR